MALNPSIILAGQPFDLAGSMSAGNQLAAQTNQLRDQNALRQVYQTQGAGILSGDQNALNALAMVDPGQAMQMQAGQLDMQATRQRMDILTREEQRQIEAAKASMTAEQAAQAAKQIEDAVKMGLAINDPAQWDAVMAQQAPQLVGQFANKQALAMKYMTMAEALKANAAPDPTEGAPTGFMWNQPGNPAAGVSQIPGTEKPQAPYTAQGKLKADLDAGRIDQAQYEAGMAALAPKGTQLSFDPTSGQMTFTQGAGVGGSTGEPLVGDVYNPGEVKAAVGLIDDILSTDPQVFNRITGTIEGGGGNNIDDLSAMQRAWYGEQGVSTIEKLGQLQSQTWLAARQMLKGGGPITDYESRKAEAAVARLSRAKGPEELKAALQELRDAITAGEEKLRAAGRLGGAPSQPSAAQQQIPQGAIDLLRQNNTPDYQRSFDEIFGQGAAARVLGGN